MAMVNRTPKPDMRECPLCHEAKPVTRFFTQDADSVCRRCQIGLFHQEMQGKLVLGSPHPKDDCGYIYLFYSALMGLYKIGKSINPRKRRGELSVPDAQLVFAFHTNTMAVHETMLHHIYQPQRVGGEWFKLHDNHVGEIKYIASKLGVVIDSLEGFDWEGMIEKQLKIERARRREIRKAKEAEDLARAEAYKAYRAQFRRRCPNCLRLFKFNNNTHFHTYHTFCKKSCRAQFKSSKRIQDAYLNDPDNIAIALVDTWWEICQHDYDETEAGVKIYRDAAKRLSELELIETELRELRNHAYDMMSKD